MNMLKRTSGLFFIGFLLLGTTGFSQKRFHDEIFGNIDSALNIQYGQAVNLAGNQEQLLLDIITPPKNDTMKNRPLLIFIHGGGFKSNTKNGNYSALVCNSFAKRGYVTATINYRLGVAKSGTNKDYFEAMYRAQQDGRAAVRFFRRYAAEYGIDTSQIFITGSSAGSKTCLGMAYMDQEEIPSEIDQAKWGTLEGESGNPGYSSRVHGVMNAWGALINYNWLKQGDAPLFNLSGTMDKTVPFDSSFDYHGFKYGGSILFEKCLERGIATGWRPFYGAGHTLDSDKRKWDSAVQSMSAWLYTQLKFQPTAKREGILRYEDEIVRFDSLNRTQTYPANSIMFLGSSYIRLWSNIRRDLQIPNIIHRGFGGCNSRDVAYYLRRIVYPHQPKALFIYIGNDIVDGERDKDPDQVLEFYKYLVKVLREKYPTMPITWLAVSPSEKRWAKWDKVCELNALVKNFTASNPNLYFIESSEHFLGADGKPITSLYRDDKLHYNEEGYKVWGNSIRDKVKAISHL